MDTADTASIYQRKIGILTFHFVYNYGAVLQAFALRSYLNRKGFAAEIIPYHPEYIYRNYSINPLKSRKGRRDQLRKAKHILENYKRIKPFLDFQKEDLQICNGKIAWTDYDVIVIGSDQVWNMEITGGDINYLGAAAEPEQKLISYAASFGVQELPTEQTAIFKKYLQRFDHLTVREESGVEILEKLGLEGQRICDPVFLLDRKEWSRYARPVPEAEDKQFVFVYLLDYNEELVKQVYETAQNENLRIFAAHPTGNRWGLDIPFISNCGPWEFLYMIEHARYVATNSFHAMSFSLIFEKDVIYFPHKTRGNRTEELFKMVNYQCRSSYRDYSDLNSFIIQSKVAVDRILGF